MSSWKIAALLALLAVAAGCTANPRVSEPAQQVQPMPSSVTIGSVEQASNDGSTRLTLHGNFPFSYTSYEPDCSTLVLELLDVDAAAIEGVTKVDSPEVESVETSVHGEGLEGGKVSQVTVHFKRPTIHELKMQGNDLIVELRADPAHPAFPESVVASAPALEPLEEAAPAGPTPEEQAALAKARPATALLSVVAKGPDSQRTVQLKTNGKVSYKAFELKNPERLVIDMEGIRSQVPPAQRSMQPKSDFLEKIRVAQFATAPQPVARVVFDMKSSRAYDIHPTPAGLTVDFSDAVASRQGRPSDSGVTVASQSADGTPAASEATRLSPQGESAAKESSASASPSHPPSDEEASSLGVNLAAQTPEGAASTGLTPVQIPAETPAEGAETSEGSGTAADLVPTTPAPKPRAQVPRETTITGPQNRFSARTISDTGQKYTGKKISLNFKDADLKDVFRIFHEISGYNIVLDPSVSGNVTIVLESVPEDQALDIILKNNGLDKIFENNVIRIASTQKLSQEAAARKQLQEAKELEENPVTFTRSLSYAKAKDVVPIVKRIMSKRGDVIMDDRTNTLVISDIAAKRDPINRLIDSLDEQTPQVSIEARIVETDREFERDLGITWGANARWDPALGTQTGLQFPHTADVSYDVTLPAKATAGSLGVSFGNVLNSFTLQAKLDAFELNGDVKILSAPRVATQNNQTAIIEQGTQIPVVNTTATEINVEFISASLRLEVTPQITKEGTVIMMVKVDNSSPDFVNRVGDVPPIITERAQTQILVEDGGTAVIGGIFTIRDSVSETGVPGLKRIPGLGWLFKNKSMNRKNTELLIFITPRILKKA
ncbi:MAG TPA: type IV pilus secretin PilQ [Candidatus Polarisedimenticolia bacterium]|jgi:type IV pilus assembly protein PilQ|nr:type IV pilus secretin PilQ [Candidatus Polarisedimenticolia bacterium]